MPETFRRTSVALVMLALAGTALAQSGAPKPASKPAEGSTTEEKPAGLRVGDAAPKLSAERWVRGEPVKSFEKGKVYVVEFWATWCGPCVKSIPDMTSLQKKHKEVTVIGVAGSERDDGTKLNAFVKDQGEKMAYRVAFDSDGSMSEAWMRAARQRGIPTAFVVDHENNVSWIGHPKSGLDEAVAQALTKAEAANADGKEKKSALRFDAQPGPVLARQPESQAGNKGENREVKIKPKLQAEAAQLALGDPAPKLDVGGWVKGEPVKAFEAGKVYVVEFWATWCGPCKVSIPHLTELQKKNPDVRFVGVAVWERDAEQRAVAKFVDAMGDKMDYAVAKDNITSGGSPQDGAMARTWMTAAGQQGIPTAFIVDQSGQVAWIGHPMVGMDEALAQIKAGKYDVKAAAAKATEARELEAKLGPISQRIQQANQARDWDKMLAALDEMAELGGPLRTQAAMQKFNVLLVGKKDADAAFALAGKLADSDLKDNAEALNSIAWRILDEPRLPKRDFDLALRLAQRAVEVSGGKEAAILDTLARAHWEKKDVANAIKFQVMAVEKAGPEEKKELEETLAKYRAGGA